MLIFVGGGIIAFVALVNIISMYGAVAVFMLYYLKLLGRHSWKLVLPMVILFPLGLFFFFRAASDEDASGQGKQSGAHHSPPVR